jgi:ribonucleotide reductase beta subunit family protein with ferritin-like domain
MDFGAEEIEFYTINYPKIIGVDWDIEKALKRVYDYYFDESGYLKKGFILDDGRFKCTKVGATRKKFETFIRYVANKRLEGVISSPIKQKDEEVVKYDKISTSLK